ncbi:adenosine receptor A2b isoform X2 [Scleropages formosus]|uniref:adenosine receptor A2b isoform X2 n=1 Tax=Scleropages formosus TaxID=113540 RepID=UPI0008791299|nr:adenosine receptor A2b isoform X2 [Scleropages formosus]
MKADTFYIAVELVIALLSISGNVLVCWAVAINTTLKNATNYFLVSLAVADILSSIFSLLAIAIDRYLAVKIPLRYNELVTGKRAREIIAILWILSFIIGLVPFLGWNKKHTVCRNMSSPANTSSTSQSCYLTCYFETVVDMRYMVYFNFFGCVLLPLLIMLAIYAKIFNVARKQLRQIELKCINGENSHSLLQREFRAAKSLSIIVGLFAFCWLPVHILNCLTLFYPVQKSNYIMYLAIILSHANSAVNPIIYAYRIRDFRNTFRKIISSHFLCRKEELYLGSGSSSQNPDEIHMTIDPLL